MKKLKSKNILYRPTSISYVFFLNIDWFYHLLFIAHLIIYANYSVFCSFIETGYLCGLKFQHSLR